MTAKNDITGDRLVSKAPSQEYLSNYDLCFKKKPQLPAEQAAIVEITNLHKNIYEKGVDKKQE